MNLLDELTYRSWWHQIYTHGMEKERARKLFHQWKAFEERWDQESKETCKIINAEFRYEDVK